MLKGDTVIYAPKDMPFITILNITSMNQFNYMAESGINLKTLQYIMTNSDISIMLNMYSHVHFNDDKEELLCVVKG